MEDIRFVTKRNAWRRANTKESIQNDRKEPAAWKNFASEAAIPNTDKPSHRESMKRFRDYSDISSSDYDFDTYWSSSESSESSEDADRHHRYHRIYNSLGDQASKCTEEVRDFIRKRGVTLLKYGFTGEVPFWYWSFYQGLFKKPKFLE